MNTKSCLHATVLLIFCGAAFPAWGQGADHIMAMPAELQWQDVASLPPGAKIATIEGSMAEAGVFTVRLKFPPDYDLPAHWHPAVERVTVLSGTFHMGLGDKLDKTKGTGLGSGGIMIMQPGVRHFAWTEGDETIVQLNGIGPWAINYVNPADDPRR